MFYSSRALAWLNFIGEGSGRMCWFTILLPLEEGLEEGGGDIASRSGEAGERKAGIGFVIVCIVSGGDFV